MQTMTDEGTHSTASQRKSIAKEQVTSVLQGDDLPVYDREYTADEEVLAALGYKAEFKREFSLWTSFCVSFAVLGLLPSFASTLYYVSPERVMVRLETIADGGPVGNGICRYTWNGMGLAHRHVLHPVCCYEHG